MGLFLGGMTGEGSATLAYSALTFGEAESNFTCGLGYGLTDGEFSDYPVIMLAGTHRISNYIALLSENYIFPNDENNTFFLGVQGIRILSRDNAFDIGVIISSEFGDGLPALPYGGYARAF